MNMIHIRRLMILMLCLMPLALCGCPAVGWLAAQAAGPEKTKPLYQPPKDKRVLVFVDDVYQPVSFQPVKSDLTAAICDQLIANKLAASTVPYEQLLDALDNQTRVLSIKEVGQKVGADLVLYVNIEKFSLKEEGNSALWHGQMQASVRWIDPNGDTRESVRLWPTDRAEGHVVPEVELPVSNDEAPSYGADLTKLLAANTANRIVRLFYEAVAPK